MTTTSISRDPSKNQENDISTSRFATILVSYSGRTHTKYVIIFYDVICDSCCDYLFGAVRVQSYGIWKKDGIRRIENNNYLRTSTAVWELPRSRRLLTGIEPVFYKSRQISIAAAERRCVQILCYHARTHLPLRGEEKNRNRSDLCITYNNNMIYANYCYHGNTWP